MRSLIGILRGGFCTAVCLSTLSCGGGNSTLSSSGGSGGTSGGTVNNVADVIVDAGPMGSDVNTLFTTVTVCVPGSTTECQTIDHIQVDTASFGLRLLAPVVTLSLPVQKAANGNSLLECTDFVDGYSWGPVGLADVQIGGETASSIPVQLIGDSRFPNVPSDCSSLGTAEDTVAAFGANGILGIGVFAQDCGSGCTSVADNGFYYSCTASACTTTTVAIGEQVSNPVASFATDNNGTIIVLPSVAAAGAESLSGSLIFGVDTQTNNRSGSETVLTVDPGMGYVTALFNGQTLTTSFIDTGSNALYFDDSTLTACTNTSFSGFYCPASTVSLTATLQGQNSATVPLSFSVGNAMTLGDNNPTFTVIPLLGGQFPSSTTTFDFGLPFYFGRKVLTVLETQSTSVGTGPYIAF